MPLDDLEHQNMVFMDFCTILNCAKNNGDRPVQPAYETFSTNRRFQWSSSRPPMFKEACSLGHQRGVWCAPSKCAFLLLEQLQPHVTGSAMWRVLMNE